MTTKQFKLLGSEIKSIAVGFGSCIATDRITVDGALVGYCYREPPEDSTDSGWRFFAGDESEAYLEDPDNLAVYDVNTVANYDHGITELLDAPFGSAFERGDTGKFSRIDAD